MDEGEDADAEDAAEMAALIEESVAVRTRPRPRPRRARAAAAKAPDPFWTPGQVGQGEWTLAAPAVGGMQTTSGALNTAIPYSVHNHGTSNSYNIGSFTQ